MKTIDPIDASSSSEITSIPSSSVQAIPTDLQSVGLVDGDGENTVCRCYSTGLTDRESKFIFKNGDVYRIYVTNTSEVIYPASRSIHMEQVPTLQDSSKQKRSARFNLRKSLAWDSSFFTGEGFLDAEELATINSAYIEVQARGFPIFQENTKTSFESSSTFNRDSRTIENTEPDISESVRASIQKSYDASDEARPVKPFSATNVARKFFDHGTNNATSDHAPRKVRNSSANMVKPPIVSRKTDLIGKERTENSKEIDHARMVGIGNVCNKQSIKASQASSRIMETRNKRISDNLLRKTNGTVVCGNCRSRVSENIVIHQESCVVVPQSSSSKISPGPAALPGMILRGSHSPSTGSRPALDQKSRTSQVTATKKINFLNKSKNSIQSSTGKSPVMISKGKKGNRGANKCQAHLNSVSKLPIVSPSSSIESTLSLSSSSSMPTKSTNCSFDAWSSSDSNFSNKSAPRTVHFGRGRPYGSMDREGNSVKSRSPCDKTSSGATVLELSPTVDDSRAHGNDPETKRFKPSGLRMPRPKIGYFDAVKGKGASKCDVVTGNAADIITPRTNTISMVGNLGSLTQIANPLLPTSTIKTDAPAPLRSSTPSPKTSRVNHLVECYENFGSSSQKSSINDIMGMIVTPGIGGEDLNIAHHLKSSDVKGMDETDPCSKPVEANNIISIAAGYNAEGIADAKDQLKQTCPVVVGKLSHENFSALSHNTELENSSVKTYEKVNLESEDPQAANVEQLEKILSSLRLSLSVGTSEKISKSHSRLEFRNSSASPVCTSVGFDVLPRTPLAESNCDGHGLIDSTTMGAREKASH